jgi:hypothetical protein
MHAQVTRATSVVPVRVTADTVPLARRTPSVPDLDALARGVRSLPRRG